MRYYPIFLDLRGQRCVVVGGGHVAERKVLALLRARADVELISPALTQRLAMLATKKRIRVRRRAYRSGDLVGVRRPKPLLVFAATNDLKTQRAIRRDARTSGALVNVADDRDSSTFLVPASFTQGDLQVAISTSGSSPALARRLRLDLQSVLGREYRAYLRFLRDARKEIKRVISGPRQRARVLRKLSDGKVLDPLTGSGTRNSKVKIRNLLRSLKGKR